MTREPTTCPLCGREGAFNTDDRAFERDAFRIQCPRCGRYVIDGQLRTVIRSAFAGRTHLLSYVTRRASDKRDEVFLDSLDTAESFASSVPQARNADDAVGRLLLALGGRTRRYMAQLIPSPDTDYPLIAAQDSSEYSDVWALASAMGFIEGAYNRITPEGWRKFESLRSTSSMPKQAFVAMMFASETETIWSNGLKPGVEASGFFTALRIDRKEFNNKIDDEIVAEIRRSGLLVADFTGHRGGVYFEAGFALGLGIPIIWTCRKDDVKNAHFDTRNYNHIDWESPADLATRLDRRIRATILPLVRSA